MIEELNKYLEKLVEDGVFPGCNYAIITNDDNFYSSVGYKELVPKKIENNIDTMYDLSSLTKVLVTNVLISFLIRDEKLRLTDNVCDYIETFKYKDIKIIHLVTHSSGLKSLFDKNNIRSKDEFIYNIDIEFTPGSNSKYSDINFILLGFIIEKLYNNTLDVLAKKMIFEPLDMKDTMYNPINKDCCAPTDLDTKGIPQDEKAQFLNGVAAHAGLFSTVYDITKFISMILHDGFYNGKKYLDLTYIDMWFTPLFISDEGIRKTIGWTYGKSTEMCSRVCSDDTIYHSGFAGSHILIDRGNDFGFVLLSNKVHPNRDNKLLIEKRQDINEFVYKLLKKYDKIY